MIVLWCRAIQPYAGAASSTSNTATWLSHCGSQGEVGGPASQVCCWDLHLFSFMEKKSGVLERALKEGCILGSAITNEASTRRLKYLLNLQWLQTYALSRKVITSMARWSINCHLNCNINCLPQTTYMQLNSELIAAFCFRLDFLSQGFPIPLAVLANCEMPEDMLLQRATWQRTGVPLISPGVLSAASQQQDVRLLSPLLPKVRIRGGKGCVRVCVRGRAQVFANCGYACQQLELVSCW